jgi:hypothetical protein
MKCDKPSGSVLWIPGSAARPRNDGRGGARLPMEFAVEAQKLIGISLEGSVG